MKLVKGQTMDQVATLMRLRQFDRYARAFLTEHPPGIVVDIGCGLDTRFDRIDNGQMEWFGLDLPEVVDLRRKLLPDGPRQHLLACSVLDMAWMDVVRQKERPVLFLAEGVFPYLAQAEVRRLVLALRDRFPGAELVFDALSTLSVRIHNAGHTGLKKTGARLGWGLDRSRELESWGDGIRLLEEWQYFSQGEPRLGWYNLLRFIPPMAKMSQILRYRLGTGG